MGRGDSSWQDRNHHIGKSRGGKKTSNPSSNPQVGESIMNSGGTGSNETYDFSKGSKAVSTTPKKRKSSLKVNISGAGGTGRNIV